MYTTFNEQKKNGTKIRVQILFRCYFFSFLRRFAFIHSIYFQTIFISLLLLLLMLLLHINVFNLILIRSAFLLYCLPNTNSSSIWDFVLFHRFLSECLRLDQILCVTLIFDTHNSAEVSHSFSCAYTVHNIQYFFLSIGLYMYTYVSCSLYFVVVAFVVVVCVHLFLLFS